jgi:hypothetical protein
MHHTMFVREQKLSAPNARLRHDGLTGAVSGVNRQILDEFVVERIQQKGSVSEKKKILLLGSSCFQVGKGFLPRQPQ